MNWTRERLKTNGKIAFKKNYWACVAVAVIMGIMGFHSHIITDGDSHLQGWQLQWLRLY